MTTINVYLNFMGQCEEAFNFYKSVFGGEFSHVARFGEMPPSDHCPAIPEKDKNLIMHVSLPISKETVLMGSDTSESFGPPAVKGNNFSLSINADSKSEVDRIFKELSKGGSVIMPCDNTFWGSYFGMFTDKFGIQWMVSCELGEH
jgi:PhnB protein